MEIKELYTYMRCACMHKWRQYNTASQNFTTNDTTIGTKCKNK